MKKQIIAMGGGGFSTEPGNPLLDRYFLKQTGKRNPRICFVPTASGDADGYVVEFYSALNNLRCKPSHLSLFRPPTGELEAFILEKDAIYVGGGNTRNLLALWREWRLDKLLRKAWQHGVVLGGISAGSMCWFEEGLTDSVPGGFRPLVCLGFLTGSNCPHYDSEPARRPVYERLIAEGKLSAGIATDDGVALHYVGRKLVRVVSSRPDKAAYRVRRVAGTAREQRIDASYLGK